MSPNVAFFGKLPFAGDFLSREISLETTDRIQEWVVAGLADSRERLGNGWKDYYLKAPIWRFVVKAGLIGEHACAGVMMPSADKVGRLFPAVLLTQLPDSMLPKAILPGALDFHSQTEELLVSLLDHASNLDTLCNGMERLKTAAETLVERTLEVGKILRDRDYSFTNSNQLGPALGDQSLLALLGLGYGIGDAAGSIWWSGYGVLDGKGNEYSVLLQRRKMPQANDWPLLLGLLDADTGAEVVQ